MNLQDETRGEMTIVVARDGRDEWSENAYAFIEELRGHLDKVPVDYRSDAKIMLRSFNDYDGYPDCNFVVLYERPATRQEMDAEREERRQRMVRETRHVANRLRELLAEAVELGADTDPIKAEMSGVLQPGGDPA